MGIYSSKDAITCLEAKQFKQVINEAYFGRTPGINRCFNAFCDFRQKYVSSSISRGAVYIDADHDKDLRLFISEMERQFGFESFSFIVRNSLSENMCTIPIIFHEQGIPVKANIKKFITIDKEGYHFVPDARMSCIIIAYAQMLFNKEYSDEEAFAIVLHEVGHNFQKFINGSMTNLSLVRSNLFLYSIIWEILKIEDLNDLIDVTVSSLLVSSRTHRTVSKLFNKLTSDTTRNNLYSYFNFISAILKAPKEISRAITIIPLAPIYGLIAGFKNLVKTLNPIGLIFHSYDYQGERIADAFPSYYGFGQARISTELDDGVADMFGGGAKLVGDIPLIGHLYNFMLLPAYILITVGDEHPMSATRAKSTLDSMKADLNDPALSPKLRKALQKEIEETEKEVDSHFNNLKLSDPHIAKTIFDKCIFVTLNGGFKYKLYQSIFDINDAKTTSKLRESADYNDIL